MTYKSGGKVHSKRSGKTKVGRKGGKAMKKTMTGPHETTAMTKTMEPMKRKRTTAGY